MLFLLERNAGAPRSAARWNAASWRSPWAADDGFSLGPPRRLTFDIVVDGAARQAVATWGADGAQVSVDGAAARHNDRIFEMGDGVIVAAPPPPSCRVQARRTRTGGAPVGEDAVRAPMNGKVIAVLVAPGQVVKLGARVAVMEAMKMEHSLTAPRDGTVAEIAAVGAQVVEGDAVVQLEPAPRRPLPKVGRDEGTFGEAVWGSFSAAIPPVKNAQGSSSDAGGSNGRPSGSFRAPMICPPMRWTGQPRWFDRITAPLAVAGVKMMNVE